MKIRNFGINIDTLDMAGAVDACIELSFDKVRCKYVVTPNVDHIVVLNENDFFKSAYINADLVLVDGWPVAKAVSFLSGASVETIPGSDLVPNIFKSASLRGVDLKVFLLGAADGVAEKASKSIEINYPGVKVVGFYSPPYGFEKDGGENSRIINKINSSCADILIIGLGAPKQEIWIGENSRYLNCGLAICAGATIDFIAGEKRRAPLFLRKIKMEWLHRLASEPQRLFSRYMRDMLKFPPIFFNELISKSNRVDRS